MQLLTSKFQKISFRGNHRSPEVAIIAQTLLLYDSRYKNDE